MSKVILRSNSETLVVGAVFLGDQNGGFHFWVKGLPEVKFSGSDFLWDCWRSLFGVKGHPEVKF